MYTHMYIWIRTYHCKRFPLCIHTYHCKRFALPASAKPSTQRQQREKKNSAQVAIHRCESWSQATQRCVQEASSVEWENVLGLQCVYRRSAKCCCLCFCQFVLICVHAGPNATVTQKPGGAARCGQEYGAPWAEAKVWVSDSVGGGGWVGGWVSE